MSSGNHHNSTSNNSGNAHSSSNNNNNSSSHNSNYIHAFNNNNSSTNKINKGLQSAFEKMKQQLDLRKLFIKKMGVSDEQNIFQGDNLKEKILFSDTVATYAIKKQIEKKQANTYQNVNSVALIESPALLDANQINYSKGNLDNNQNDEEDIPYDSYFSLYYLTQEQLIPPLTSGESSPSVSDEDPSYSQKGSKSSTSKSGYGSNGTTRIPQSTSLEDVLLYLVDSNLLQIEKEPQVQRATKTDRSQPWQNCNELLFSNISVTQSLATLKKEMRERFKTFQFVFFEKFRTLYYQGKYSLLVTFGEENNAQFVYFNYKKNQQQYRAVLGDNLDVYKINSNNLDFYLSSDTLPHNLLPKSKGSSSSSTNNNQKGWWVPVILRNLPIHFEHNNIIRLLQSLPCFKSVQNVEELIILNEKKHTMIVFSDMDSALYLLQQVPIKFKDFSYIRANLHPNFTKQSWINKNMKENPYYAFYKPNLESLFHSNSLPNATLGSSSLQSESAQTYLQSSKTCQLLKFKKSFLEDVVSIHKIYKSKRSSDKDDDLKKLSQRSTTPIYHHEKNIEIEHHERFISQKSSLRRDNDTPSSKEENSYLDNPPSTESFHKIHLDKREQSQSRPKQQNYSYKSYEYSEYNKKISKSSKYTKEDRYETPSLDPKHSISKEKISNYQQRYESPKEEVSSRTSNRAPEKIFKSYSRTKTQESQSNLRKYGTPQKQDYDGNGQVRGNRTPEKNFKTYSRTRRQVSNSHSRSGSRKRKSNKKSDVNYKEQRKRTPTPPSEYNQMASNSLTKHEKKQKHKNSIPKNEGYTRNYEEQCRSESESKKKQVNYVSTNEDEELRKYFENKVNQEKNSEENINKEQDDRDLAARSPQSDDWGLSNDGERSSRHAHSENKLNEHDEIELRMNIEQQINKQFMRDFLQQENIDENQHQSDKKRIKNEVKEEDIQSYLSKNETSNFDKKSAEKRKLISSGQKEHQLGQEHHSKNNQNAIEIETQYKLKIEDKSKSSEDQQNQEINMLIKQELQAAIKEENIQIGQEQSYETNAAEDNTIITKVECEGNSKEQGQVTSEPVQVIHKMNILRNIEQSDEDDDDDDDDDSSITSNSRGSSSISSSRSRSRYSSSDKGRSSVNNDRKGNLTHSNKRGNRDYQKNNNKYHKNYQNNFNYPQNNYNRFGNYTMNNNNYSGGNYKRSQYQMNKNANQISRTRSRSSSSQRYNNSTNNNTTNNNKRSYEKSNSGQNQNNNSYNRYNNPSNTNNNSSSTNNNINANNNRNFHQYSRSNYHGGYQLNQYNNSYSNQNYNNRHRSSSKRSRSNNSSDRKSPSYHKKKSNQRSPSKSQVKQYVQHSSSKTRQKQHSRTPSFTKENQSKNKKNSSQSQQRQQPQQEVSQLAAKIIKKNKDKSNEKVKSSSRSNSQKKQSVNTAGSNALPSNNKNYKKNKKYSRSPSDQNKNNDNKSPSSEEGEYDENNQATHHHQFRQRGGYQRNYKGNNNNYRKDNNNFKKNRAFNYNNQNIYDRRGQSRESHSPYIKAKDRRSNSQSPRSRPQKYAKRDNEAFKKNQNYDNSPSSPYSPSNQGNYHNNENRLKYNSYQRGNQKYQHNNHSNEDRYKYNPKYNNNNSAYNNINNSNNTNNKSRSRSRSRSSYKSTNLQKTSSAKYN